MEHKAEDESMTHYGMWKLSDDDYSKKWSYSDEKPPPNTDPNDDVTKKEKPKMVGVLEMFRFADWKDRILLVVGILSATAHGCAFPLQILFLGDVIDLFINNDKLSDILNRINWNETRYTRDQASQRIDILGKIAHEQNLTSYFEIYGDSANDDLLDGMLSIATRFSILASVALVLVAISSISLQITGMRQTKRLRLNLLRSILRQDISWYDVTQTGELHTILTTDVNVFHEGIGDKIAQFFQWTATFVAGLAVGFATGWKIALVVLATLPLLALAGFVMNKLQVSFTGKELSAYAKAGAVAEEVLGAIRTVYAFGGQKKECDRYASSVTEAAKFGKRTGMVSGLGLGAFHGILYGTIALTLYWGTISVREDDFYTPGRMITIMFSVSMCGFSLGNASPALVCFSSARAAAYAIWQILDRVPPIDSSSDTGKKPNKVEGNIQLRNVRFRYPARPDVQVMDGINLSVNVGQTVALVGPSGCGKSTSIQLIQRFYDPDEGSVLLDGIDIKDLNIKWLRQQIGVVSQEPVLFGTTIGENIRYGRDGVTQAEIEAAAREANAHAFISKLPMKYETMVGERGAQLSGGQKQRIAIARALVRNPKILLLDEATSALDTESEATVQAALDKARKGRTTIVIAHRLSTVRTADVIVGIENGRVVEQGTHEQLMEKKGIYCTLVTNQTSKSSEEEEIQQITVDRRKSTVRRLTRGASLRSQRSLVGDVEEEEEGNFKDVSMIRLLRMNSPEWKFIAIGCLAAMVNGAAHTTFAIMLAEVFAIFSLPLDEQESRTNTIILYIVIIMVVSFCSHSLQGTFMGISGEGLTYRIRCLAFISFLRQEIAYFDEPRHNIGALTTRLATGASAVKGATGARLALILQDTTSLGTAIIIGFIYSWLFTLGILAFIPCLLGTAFLQMRMVGGMAKRGHAALEDASKVAVEVIENIRTVASLTKEETLVDWYHTKISEPYRNNRIGSVKLGIAYGISQSVLFFMWAACFSLAAHLVHTGNTKFEDVFKVFLAVMLSSMQAGRAASMAPDFRKAKLQAAKIFDVIDREPEIDNLSENGISPEVPVVGRVEFKNVEFKYPTRPTVSVLQGLNIRVNPGQTLALVGSSGCGKSTTIQLLQRFYDPLMGIVMLDGEVTSDLNINWLRSKMGIVSQEPTLFDASIRENIAYGDNSREVPMDQIIEAAKKSNIHEFIRNLPGGYETNVGDKGTQLSGGQKQRIAIARALVRNPKILLLDEATSALDTESEKVVQEALDRARQGRTSIVIAHRLSTVQNADLIAVIHQGKVVELGTHSELIAMKGRYYRLNNAQLKRS